MNNLECSSFSIRAANAQDVEAVSDCAHAAYSIYKKTIGVSPAPLFVDYGELIGEGSVRVIVDRSKVVDFFVAIVKSDCLALANIAIHPDYEGRYLSARCLHFVEKLAVENGLDRLTLFTNVKMEANIRLYTLGGFVEIERRVESGYSRVYMEKTLE